jgi:hypothetical protein
LAGCATPDALARVTSWCGVYITDMEFGGIRAALFDPAGNLATAGMLDAVTASQRGKPQSATRAPIGMGHIAITDWTGWPERRDSNPRPPDSTLLNDFDGQFPILGDDRPMRAGAGGRFGNRGCYTLGELW